MNKWEWETCDCEFPEEINCGCENPRSHLTKDRAIHWLGKHWRLECAFDHAINLIKEKENT